jgi:hypothetical protein
VVEIVIKRINNPNGVFNGVTRHSMKVYLKGIVRDELIMKGSVGSAGGHL